MFSEKNRNSKTVIDLMDSPKKKRIKAENCMATR
jgi:hypothetical protein